MSEHEAQTPQFGTIKDYELSRGDFVFKLKETSAAEAGKRCATSGPQREVLIGTPVQTIGAGASSTAIAVRENPTGPSASTPDGQGAWASLRRWVGAHWEALFSGIGTALLLGGLGWLGRSWLRRRREPRQSRHVHVEGDNVQDDHSIIHDRRIQVGGDVTGSTLISGDGVRVSRDGRRDQAKE